MTAQEIKIRIEGLKQQLVAKYHPEKVILFGSAARVSEVVNDVDVFIVKADVRRGENPPAAPSYGHRPAVDYLVYRPSEVAERLALGDSFVTEVLKVGIVLYG